MRLPRWFVVPLLGCAALLAPQRATAIGCWLCQNQLTTCRYYRQGELSSCLSGCETMFAHGSPAWNLCEVDCDYDNQSGLAACQSDYDYCANGCQQDPPEHPKQNCPIVLDLDRGGLRFTSVQEGVLFDIDGDGHRDWIAWTDPQSDEGFLVWDRNLNGRIDSGSELFGDSTLQPPSAAPNGFLALSVLDDPQSGGNGDGVLSSQDRLWNALQIWVDRNHNGRSEENELTSLSSHKVVAIDIDYRESRRKDRYGNELRYWGRVLLEDGPPSRAVDVFFQGLR